MRILYHHRTQAEDGQAVHIRALQRAFAQEGCELREVGLVAQGGPAGGAGAGRSRWGWVTRLPGFARELAEYGYNPVARRRLVAEARSFRPDLLYERYAFGNAAGVLAARRLGLPLVLEVNSPMVVELARTRGLAFPRAARRLERWIFRGADRVCVVTGVLRSMLEEMGVEPERLLVTPNGVELERYEGADREAARRELGLPPADEGCVLGFVGYYRTWHRLDLAVEALARPALARARLVLVGAGPAHGELARRAEELGVFGRVHFAGARPHDAIPGLLAAFDVALVPAINAYASPLKLHEYMAAGLAVIAPDQENLREVIEDDRNGLLVAPGDGEAFAGAIEALAADRGRRERLGSAARATVVERDLTWRGNARRILAEARALRGGGR